MTKLTPEHRAAIEARLAKAAPGPWAHEPDERYGGECHMAYSRLGSWEERFVGRIESEANADLIAHAPTDIAAMLAALAERDAEVARLRGLLFDEGLCPDCGALDSNMWGPYGHETRCPKTRKTEAL